MAHTITYNIHPIIPRRPTKRTSPRTRPHLRPLLPPKRLFALGVKPLRRIILFARNGTRTKVIGSRGRNNGDSLAGFGLAVGVFGGGHHVGVGGGERKGGGTPPLTKQQRPFAFAGCLT